jgi:hypothetical protein
MSTNRTLIDAIVAIAIKVINFRQICTASASGQKDDLDS